MADVKEPKLRGTVHPQILTTGEVARLFRVSGRAIREWADDGRLGPVMYTLGGHRRFSAKHVKALFQQSFGYTEIPEAWPPL